MIWHKGGQTTVSKEVLDARLRDIIRRDRWIIAGNHLHALGRSLTARGTVFLLELPVHVCLSGARTSIGKRREDLPWADPEFDDAFQRWITRFPTAQLPQTYHPVEPYRNTGHIVIFKTRKEADARLSGLRNRPHQPESPSISLS